MASSFGGIEISKRSLFTHQAALATAGHNIANADTAGYSRQVVKLVAAKPMEAVGLMRSTVPGQSGQGVEFTSITRIREQFLDGQYYNESKNLGQWTVRQDTLEKLEKIINEPSESGVRKVIDQFWQAWQELSKAPDNLTARAVVKESAIAMADAFNQTSSQLRDLGNDLTDNIRIKAAEANTMIAQLASLNETIFRVEGLGNNANDLRDQRDAVMDDLSRLLNVSVVEEERGYRVMMGGVELVQGNQPGAPLTAESLEASMSTGDLNTGELYGMFVSRDYYVANYQDQLDAIASAISTGDVEVKLPKGTVIPNNTTLGNQTFTGSVDDRTLQQDLVVTVKGLNGLHRLGYTMTDPMQTGPDFFVARDGGTAITASNIKLNDAIANSLEMIAASNRTHMEGTTEKTVNGNNEAALLIAGMRLQKFQFAPNQTGSVVMDKGTIDEFFRAVVGEIGVQAKEASRRAANQMVLLEQVDARRQAVSGVSLDEEMANMIKYQHAYNAAARALTAQDEILDKVINGMGVVGR